MTDIGSWASGILATDPKTYNAMELRKRIALAQMMQKRAYPKTFGEGLASIGDSIGDVMTMRQLERQQAAYDASKLAEKKAEEGGGPRIVNEGEDPPDRPGTRTVAGPTVYPEVRPPTEANLPIVEPPELQPDPNRRVVITAPPTDAPQTQIQPRSLEPPLGPTALAASMSPSQNPLMNQYPIEQGAPPFPGPDVASQQVPRSVAMRQPMQAPPPGNSQGLPPPWLGQTVANGQRMAGPQPIGGSPGPSGVPGQQAAGPPPDVRSDIAMQLAQRGPGGPPPNPMTGGAIPASMPQNPLAGGPPILPPMGMAAVGSQPSGSIRSAPDVMSDISSMPRLEPGTQLAQAQVKAPNPMEGRPRVYVQEPAGPATGVQVPAVRPAPPPEATPGAPERGQAPAVYDRPVEPKPFKRTDDPPDLTRFRRNERYADDPDMKAYWAAKAADVEKQRAAVDERLQKEYENKYNAYIQADQAWLAHQRSLPKTQAETSQAQSEASVKADQAVISSRHGGIPAEKVFADFADRQKLAKANVDMLKQAKIARQALDAGIFSGPLANLQLDKARLEAWMLKNKAAGDLATNSQLFRAAVESTLGGAVRTIQPGGGPTTETDMRIAKGIVGATPELQEAAKRKILNQFIGNLHGDLADYEDRVGRSFGGLPKVEPHWEVNRPPLHGDPAVEKQYVDRLLENKDNLAARKRFDELFGEGAAALEIARAKRRGGR